MAYTPPTYNNIVSILLPDYSPPAYNALDVDLSESGLPPTQNTAPVSMVYSMKLGTIIELPYSLLFVRTAYIEQLYSSKMGMALVLYYGDAPLLAKSLLQYYGDCPLLSRSLAMWYDDMAQLIAPVDMEYAIPRGLQQIAEMRYGLNGDALVSFINHQYDILDKVFLKKRIDQTYMLQEGQTVEYVSTGVAITPGVNSDGVANIDMPSGGLNSWTPVGDEDLPEPPAWLPDGISGPLVPHHVNVEYSLDSFVATGEIQLSRETDYTLIRMGDGMYISLNGEVHALIVSSEPRRVISKAAHSNYVVEGASPTIRLTSPWCPTFSCVFDADTARNIFEALADPFIVDWQIIDFPIVADTLYANDEDKYSVMKKITDSVGACIQPTPDGNIKVIYRYPVPVNQWATAAPDFFLTDTINFTSQNETFIHNKGFNRYQVGDMNTPEDAIWADEEDCEVKAFEVPWKGTEMQLEHTSGSSVVIQYMGIVEETYPPLLDSEGKDNPPEQVEFVAGFAKLSKPFYGVVSVEALRSNLGSLTYGEDGTVESELKTGSTDGYSLYAIRYITRYKLWKVDNGTEDEVQYILRVMTDEPDSSQSCY